MKKAAIILSCMLACFILFTGCTAKKGSQVLLKGCIRVKSQRRLSEFAVSWYNLFGILGFRTASREPGPDGAGCGLKIYQEEAS